MDEIEQLRQRLQQLEKELNEVQQDFLTGLTQLWVELAPMKSLVRSLRDDENEGWYTREERHEFFGIIEDSIDRFGRLINDLRNGSYFGVRAARLKMNSQKEVEVRQIIEFIVELQQGHTNRQILVIDFSPDRIFIETDPQMFMALSETLINNAIKYSFDGEEVRISARLEPPNSEYPYGTLLIQVKDSGRGLSKVELKRLKEKAAPIPPGHTINPPIGMLLVYKIVEAHHGVIWYDSEGVDRGTSFYVRIPVKQSRTEKSLEADAGTSD